jgi:glutaredoxin-related protein
MNKKLFILTILFILALILSSLILWKNKEISQNLGREEKPNSKNQIILFYGDGCPACAIVEDYIEKNNVKEKIEFEQKEVYYNKKNADELTEKAKTCGISAKSIEIPFLWDESGCLVGSQNIINFFKQKAEEK